MDDDVVMRWIAGYERAWREGDVEAVARLFIEHAAYRPSPYEPSEVGHEAIKALWLDGARPTGSAPERATHGAFRSDFVRRDGWPTGLDVDTARQR